MAKFAHANVLQNGPAYIKANANKMMLVSAYTVGDSLATCNSNKLAEVTMASGDYTFSASGSDQVLTTATKTGTATATAASPNLHFVFHDGTNVLWVTDETTDQPITSGNPVDFPALPYTAKQPT